MLYLSVLTTYYCIYFPKAKMMQAFDLDGRPSKTLCYVSLTLCWNSFVCTVKCKLWSTMYPTHNIVWAKKLNLHFQAGWTKILYHSSRSITLIFKYVGLDSQNMFHIFHIKIQVINYQYLLCLAFFSSNHRPLHHSFKWGILHYQKMGVTRHFQKRMSFFQFRSYGPVFVRERQQGVILVLFCK